VARFSPRPQLSGPPAPLTVGFVGRLERRKGLDFVWRVMEELGRESQIRFTFKGAIHPATRPQTLMMLERFSAVADYHPSGSPEDMPDFYRSIDVLLLPSRFESFGLTYAEAMASGVVVFAGQGGGGPELISDGVNGFLVDPDGSTTNVVSRLRLMAADRSIYNAISLAARSDIVAGYSIEQFGAAKVASYRVVHQEAEARRARAGVRNP
jgi:glycosyltransferase involved in cell wall biosynthesis